MDEVRARRALQRVAYTEDWLEKLKDDLAAGHARSAMTHLITAQAELKLLSEQLAPELGWAPEPALEVAPAVSLATPVFALPGIPRRSPLAWASLAVAAFALVLYTGVLVPKSTSRTTPIQPVTETGDPAATLAEMPSLPAPVFPEPDPSATTETIAPDLASAEPTTVVEEPSTATDAPKVPVRKTRTRRPQVEPAGAEPTAAPDPLPAEAAPVEAQPIEAAAEPPTEVVTDHTWDVAQTVKRLLGQ